MTYTIGQRLCNHRWHQNALRGLVDCAHCHLTFDEWRAPVNVPAPVPVDNIIAILDPIEPPPAVELPGDPLLDPKRKG